MSQWQEFLVPLRKKPANFRPNLLMAWVLSASFCMEHQMHLHATTKTHLKVIHSAIEDDEILITYDQSRFDLSAIQTIEYWIAASPTLIVSAVAILC